MLSKRIVCNIKVLILAMFELGITPDFVSSVGVKNIEIIDVKKGNDS